MAPDKVRKVLIAFSFIPILAGIGALVSWYFNFPFFNTFSPGRIVINPLTAVFSIISGIILFVLGSGKNSALVLGLSGIIIALGAVRIFDELGMPMPDPDMFFLRKRLYKEELLAGMRMSSDAAIAFTVLNIAFITFTLKRKAYIELLKENKAKFKAIFDNTFEFIVLMNPSGIMVDANKITQEVSGLKLEEIIGNPLWEAPWWRQESEVFDRLKLNLERARRGEFSRFEEIAIVPGRIIKLDLSITPVYDEKNKLKWILGEGRDITELKELQNKLQDSESMLRESQEIAHIGSFEFDLINNKVKGTAEHLRIHGLEEGEELTVDEVNQKIHPDDYQRISKDYQDSIKSKKKTFYSEFRILTDQGMEKHIISRGKIFYNENGEAERLLGSIMDISERVKAEQEIKYIREFVFLADNIPQLLWTARVDGTIDYFNKRCYEYSGLTPEELADWGWRKMIYPGHLEKTMQVWKQSIVSGNNYELEYCLKRYDGSYRWFLAKGVPMKNAEGKIIKWLGTSTDIQEQKERTAELRETNRQLKKINEDLDNFVYTASHDLKAPISNIEGLLEVLKADAGPKLNPAELEVFNMLSASVKKLSVTMNDLSNISRIQKQEEFEIEEACFKDILEEVKISIHSMIASSEAQIFSDLKVECISFSKKYLRSILYNLLTNAIKYRSPERNPRITISTEENGPYVLLKVKDNGLGIDITKKDKVFGMFRRLHNHVEGSGVGMYIVKRIVDNAGGKIDLESEIGKGSTFKVYFKK